MTDICERAQIAYTAGVDPIDYAETELTVLINAHFRAAAEALIRPGLMRPKSEVGTPAMTRRIIACLLDAGWTAPEVTG